MECGDTPDHEDAACDMDQLESYFARRGQYEEAAMVNGASRRMREDSEELARLRESGKRIIENEHERTEECLRLRAEVEKLRADVAWAVRHGASAGYDGDSHPAVWYEVDSSRMTRWGIPVTSVEYDGTDASLLSAVRRAREQNNA